MSLARNFLAGRLGEPILDFLNPSLYIDILQYEDLYDVDEKTVLNQGYDETKNGLSRISIAGVFTDYQGRIGYEKKQNFIDYATQSSTGATVTSKPISNKVVWMVFRLLGDTSTSRHLLFSKDRPVSGNDNSFVYIENGSNTIKSTQIFDGNLASASNLQLTTTDLTNGFHCVVVINKENAHELSVDNSDYIVDNSFTGFSRFNQTTRILGSDQTNDTSNLQMFEVGIIDLDVGVFGYEEKEKLKKYFNKNYRI